jgi:aryl-alcohol dehydrogenase-like predicted oxidoreductase
MEDGNWGKDFSPKYLRAAVEASLGRLKTDYLDLYHMHSPRDNSWMEEDTVTELEKLRREGKIRAFGLSVKPPEAGDPEVQALEAMNNFPELSFFQIVYNILEQAPARSFFPRAMEMQRGIIARVPLASGFLSGKIKRETRFPKEDNRHDRYPPERIESLADLSESLSFLSIPGKRTMAQAALQFVLAHPAVTTVIPGARKPEQVEANVAALDVPGLTESDMTRISEILGEKKSYMKL